MIERLLELEPALRLYFHSKNSRVALSDRSWTELHLVKKLLEPFSIITTLLQDQQHPLIAYSWLVISELFDTTVDTEEVSCRQVIINDDTDDDEHKQSGEQGGPFQEVTVSVPVNDFPPAKHMRKNITEQIQRHRRTHAPDDDELLAMVLDPRVISCPLVTNSMKDQGYNLLELNMEDATVATTTTTTTTTTTSTTAEESAADAPTSISTPPPKKKLRFSNSSKRKCVPRARNSAAQINLFKTNDGLECEDVFDLMDIDGWELAQRWWNDKKAQFPMIALVARSALSVFATSTLPESMFSVSGMVSSGRKARIHPDNCDLRTTMFLNRDKLTRVELVPWAKKASVKEIPVNREDVDSNHDDSSD